MRQIQRLSGWLTLLLALPLAGCRTGSDGDPWAHLYASEEDETESDSDEEDNTTPEQGTDLRGSDPEDAEATDDSDAADATDSTASTTDDEVAQAEQTDGVAETVDTLAETDDATSNGTVTDDGATDEQTDTAAETETMVTDAEAMSPPPEPVCFESREVCDGQDNDCDDEVDEGFVCPPDPGVTGGVPFTGGLYIEGLRVRSSAPSRSVQLIWPTTEESYLQGSDELSDRFHFRRSDGQLFWLVSDGLVGSLDGHRTLAECEATVVVKGYDFDADNQLYYVCGDRLYREDEQLDSLDVLLAVTDDGRIVARHDRQFGHWDDGFIPAEIEIASPEASYSGITVAGNIAVLALRRDDAEIMVFKFDESSRWSVMRRLDISDKTVGGNVFALTDGTVLWTQAAPDDSTVQQAVISLPDGTEEVIWRGNETAVIKNLAAFHVGPRELSQVPTQQ